MQGIQSPEGKYQELYTPSANPIVSSRSEVGPHALKYVKIMPLADESVTWQDSSGTSVTATLKGGIVYPFLVTKVTAAASGSILLVHDGR